MKLKKMAALLAAGLLAVSLSACGGKGADKDGKETGANAGTGTAKTGAAESGEEAGEEVASTEGLKVGISMPAGDSARWQRDGSFLKQAFEEAGYETDLRWAGGDADKQKADVRGMISDQVSLLVIAPVEGENLAEVLGDAGEAGIPVISCDGLIRNTDAVTTYVSFDSYIGGTLAGQYIVKELGLKLDDKSHIFNIEFVSGDPEDTGAGAFFNGAYDVLSPYMDAGVLSVLSGEATFGKTAVQGDGSAGAAARMRDILANYYGDGAVLDAVVCTDDAAAAGVAEALASDYTEKNEVLVTGAGGADANLTLIADGHQSMTVWNPTADEAVVVRDLGLAFLRGESPDAALIGESAWGFDCTYDTISCDNGMGIVPSYLLLPTVLTKDNLQAELVDKGYGTADENGYIHPVA